MLRQFVGAFNLASNQVYITGESYGGHYVPASAFMVAANNAAGKQPLVNLQGVAIGNGFVAPLEMVGGYADIIFNAGLLSPAEYLTAQSYVRNITAKITIGDYVGAYKAWDAFLNGDSTPGGAWYTNVTGLTNYFNVATETSPSFGYYSAYVTSPAVRAALGVGNATYNDGNLAVEIALEGDVMFSQKERLEALLQQGFQAVVYNGALDLICGAPLTERYIQLLNWPGNTFFNQQPKVIWNDPAYPGGAVSGYARAGGNLTFVVMRGAGHMAVRCGSPPPARARAGYPAFFSPPPLLPPPPPRSPLTSRSGRWTSSRAS
jgi:vitellogenic carboxypeptidase-like protein